MERIVEQSSICIRDIAMLFFSKELFLASLDVRDNRIEVVVRVPEQDPERICQVSGRVTSKGPQRTATSSAECLPAGLCSKVPR